MREDNVDEKIPPAHQLLWLQATVSDGQTQVLQLLMVTNSLVYSIILKGECEEMLLARANICTITLHVIAVLLLDREPPGNKYVNFPCSRA